MEARRRIEMVLQKLEGSERRRQSRAVGLLEHIGSAEASKELQRLEGGAAEARLTLDARAALERLAKRPPKP